MLVIPIIRHVVTAAPAHFEDQMLDLTDHNGSHPTARALPHRDSARAVSVPDAVVHGCCGR